jgi:hypothetical protein
MITHDCEAPVKSRLAPGAQRDGEALLARGAPDEERSEALVGARRRRRRPEVSTAWGATNTRVAPWRRT